MRINPTAAVLGLGAVGAALIYFNAQSVGAAISGAATTALDDVTAALTGWQSVEDGPIWLPTLNAQESASGIPPNLLARMAYQESHFRPDIIDGTTPSPAGALGILQLMPAYFSTVQVPVPFSTADTTAQIAQAAAQLVSLYNHYGDWGLAVAAYNDGQGNVDAYRAGTRQLPAETVNYVAQVFSDVPLPAGSSLPA